MRCCSVCYFTTLSISVCLCALFVCVGLWTLLMSAWRPMWMISNIAS